MKSAPIEAELPVVRELTITDIESLRLGWWSRFDPSEVEAVLVAAPGISTWIPGSHEYALVGPWRHRGDIVHLVELMAIRHPVELVAAAVERARLSDARLFLAVEMTERRQSSFYDRIGLSVLEEVMSYELLHPKAVLSGAEGIEAIAPEPASLDILYRIDSDAFPWLWRNSCAEFTEYLRQPGVEVHVFSESGAPVGYVGVTAYHGWGHIDRVAVRTSVQGRGIGRKLTKFAIAKLASLGSTRIGLSTQRRNRRSQALYEGLGFVRQASGDYQIYGRALRDGERLDELVIGPHR
jgi:ribosomal protein S18 acetylase RimI-like enzyme